MGNTLANETAPLLPQQLVILKLTPQGPPRVRRGRRANAKVAAAIWIQAPVQAEVPQAGRCIPHPPDSCCAGGVSLEGGNAGSAETLHS